MTSVEQMREALHKKVDAADEATLVSMLQSDRLTDNEVVDALEMQEILRRRERHLRGEGSVYTWDEIVANLRRRSPNV